MTSYRDLIFTAEPIGEGTFGPRYNLFARTKGTASRGALFATLRALSDTGWTITSDDEQFRSFAQENIGCWCYTRKNAVPIGDVLFICRVSYVMFYHKDELRTDIDVIDSVFLHGDRKELEGILYSDG